MAILLYKGKLVTFEKPIDHKLWVSLFKELGVEDLIKEPADFVRWSMRNGRETRRTTLVDVVTGRLLDTIQYKEIEIVEEHSQAIIVRRP